MAKKTCDGCGAKCCRYVAIEIDTPETKEDFENIKWYVCHKNINVYFDCDDVWHIEFLTPCEFIGDDNLCTIYEKRPQICRDYSVETCLHHNDYEEHTFTCVEDVEDYMKEIFD